MKTRKPTVPTYVPPSLRVVLHGGPLDGQTKNVRRHETEARFQEPLGSRKWLYRRDQDGVWRWAENKP